MASPTTGATPGPISGMPAQTTALTGLELIPIAVPPFGIVGSNRALPIVTLATTILGSYAPQNPNAVFAGPAAGVSTAVPAFRALVPLDLPGLVSNGVSSSYAVATTDMNKLIALSGNPGTAAPFTLSLATASGYTTSFVVTFYNESTVRGWAIAPNGVATFILWPLQTVQVFNDNNNWKLSPAVQPWVVPAGTQFNVDNVNGSDSTVNDGLSNSGGAGAFATIQHTYSVIQKQGFQVGAGVNIQLPAVTSTAITEQLVIGGAMPPGVSVITIMGNPATATNCQWVNSSGPNVNLTDYQSSAFNGIGFSGNGHAFALASQFAIIDFQNCDFGPNGGIDVEATENSRVNFLSGCSISGTSSIFARSSDNSSFSVGSPIKVNGTSNVGIFAYAIDGGSVDLTGLAFTGNTSGLSGQRFVATQGGIVFNDSGVVWPSGMSNGSTSNGGLSDAGAANYNGSATVLAATPLVSGGTTGAGYTFFSVVNFGVFAGTGVPTLTAGTSSLYLRNDATGSTTRSYINTNGGSTWVAQTAAG